MALTLISQKEFNHIARTDMTAEEAYRYLCEEAEVITFAERLGKYIKSDSDKNALVGRLCEYMPGLSKNSAARKVRGWLNGKYEPSDRETCFQICFALDMDLAEAEKFTAVCFDSGFHYRNPGELVYAFAFKTHMGYKEATELFESLPLPPKTKGGETVYTETLYGEFLEVETVDEFKAFYMRNLDKLGVLHNTAYEYFTDFMEVLTEPDVNLKDFTKAEEDRFSIEKTVESYLRMNMPGDLKSDRLTYIQKAVKRYWPSATSVKNMMCRREDVKRKVLVLLYLITEGIIENAPYEFIFEEGLTEEEIFKEHYNRLNCILSECGFALLEPRNPFDWVVLYTLKMNNNEVMAEEMQRIINEIFGIGTDGETDPKNL
ncbi:MAG: hypothetical protein LUD77_04795 [Clostridiales bacterium]|nr:hypothetical protein [Clostridiales bacterium]